MIRGELADQAQRLIAERTPFVVATVVRARRPTSVLAGFSALVLADGTITGFVGGTCAESSVRLHSLRALETGEPLLLRLIPGDPSGVLQGDSEGAVIEHNPCLSGGSLEIFIEPQLPPARIVIAGSAPIATALQSVARASGYDVVRAAGEEIEVATGVAAVIVASHGAHEERVLAEALSAGVPYVALVASQVRGGAVRDSLELPEQLRAQLHTPAGLQIGASTPEEVAISIIAELIAERHAQPAAPVAATATAVDPVCGMEVAVAPATLHLDVDGRREYFCSGGCRDAYAEQRHVTG